MGHVEQDVVVAALLQFVVDGAGHDVARGQLLPRIVLGHEGLAVPEAQDTPSPRKASDSRKDFALGS